VEYVARGERPLTADAFLGLTVDVLAVTI